MDNKILVAFILILAILVIVLTLVIMNFKCKKHKETERGYVQKNLSNNYRILNGKCIQTSENGQFRTADCNDMVGKTSYSCQAPSLTDGNQCNAEVNYGLEKECSDCSKSVNTYRVRLVDARNGNFLLRGPQFMNEYTLQMEYDVIVDAIRKRIVQAGYNPVSNFYLINFNLQSPFEKSYALEKTFFEGNPNKGIFVNFGITGFYGDFAGLICAGKTAAGPLSTDPADMAMDKAACASGGFSPDMFSPTSRKIIASSFWKWSPDNLEGAIDQIYSIMNIKSTVPTCVYFHCASGKDRTGTIAAAYSMKYLNYSWHDAMCSNIDVITDLDYSIVIYYMWFAEYLKTKGYSNIGDVKLPLKDCASGNTYLRGDTCEQCKIPFPTYQKEFCQNVAGYAMQCKNPPKPKENSSKFRDFEIFRP
jgi:hypothetical protein